MQESQKAFDFVKKVVVPEIDKLVKKNVNKDFVDLSELEKGFEGILNKLNDNGMISGEALSRYTGGMRSSDFKQDIEEFMPKKNMDISMKDKLMYSFGRGLESVGLKKFAQFCYGVIDKGNMQAISDAEKSLGSTANKVASSLAKQAKELKPEEKTNSAIGKIGDHVQKVLQNRQEKRGGKGRE